MNDRQSFIKIILLLRKIVNINKNVFEILQIKFIERTSVKLKAEICS